MMNNWAVEFTNLSRSDGSALLSVDETLVQAAINGPAEVSLSRELYDKALLEVNFRPLVGQSGCAERLTEAHVKHAIEATVMADLHPRTCITVILQEVQNDGNLLACSINSAILALLDAGITLKYMVAAVTAGITSDGDVKIFPNEQNQKDCKSIMTFSFESQDKGIVDIATSGCFTEQEFEKCLGVSKKVSEDVFAFYKHSIKSYYKKSENVESN